MKPETLKRCVAEAKEFVKLAGTVETTKIGNREFVESGKASGLVRAQSLILTRALADLRQGR